jgi:putative endonuclease
MHFIYIIYTSAFGKFYVGESIDPIERLSQHNSGFYKGSSTSYTQDWELKLVLSVLAKEDAVKIERYIKSMKSKAFLIKLVSDDVFLQEFKRIVKEKFKIEFH